MRSDAFGVVALAYQKQFFRDLHDVCFTDRGHLTGGESDRDVCEDPIKKLALAGVLTSRRRRSLQFTVLWSSSHSKYGVRVGCGQYFGRHQQTSQPLQSPCASHLAAKSPLPIADNRGGLWRV